VEDPAEAARNRETAWKVALRAALAAAAATAASLIPG
jgi:hypothetical protein